MQTIYLICGVPGSGKTWVCNQLTDKFTYIANDDFIGSDPIKEAYRASRSSEKPVLFDCPFGERLVRDNLINKGCQVIPVFVIEDPQTTKKRYESREGKPFPSQHLTRSMSIGARAEQWRAKSGTSEEILQYLRGI